MQKINFEKRRGKIRLNKKVKENLRLKVIKLAERKHEVSFEVEKQVEAYENYIKCMRNRVKGIRFLKSKHSFTRLMRKIELPKTFLSQPTRQVFEKEMRSVSKGSDEKRTIKNYDSFFTGSGKIDLSDGNIFDPNYKPEDIMPPKVLKFSTESPQREGLRRNKPQGETLMGIHSSPSFGLKKKMMMELSISEEKNYNENIVENENLENSQKPEIDENSPVVVTEEDLDRRVFRSIENLIKPEKSRQEKAKETIDKGLIEVRKEIEECDVLSGKFFEELNKFS